MKEWKVLRNGVVWSDRINSEALAYYHVEECVKLGMGDVEDYEVLEMTHEEVLNYENI